MPTDIFAQRTVSSPHAGGSPGGLKGLLSCRTPAGVHWLPSGSGSRRGGGFLAVKKIFLIVVLVVGAFAIWRKVQSDRAELDLWTEATTADEV